MGRIIYILLVLIVALIDFCIKKAIIINIKEVGGIKLLNGILEIVYSENKGAAFGIFNNSGYFLIIVSIFTLIFLFYLLFNRRINNKLFLVSCSFAVGGGIGNLLDRLLYGHVIDYIKFSFFPTVCNLADYFITIGVSGIMFYIIFLSGGKDNINTFGSNK